MSEQREVPDRLRRRAIEFRATTGGELTTDQIARIEWCEVIEGALSQALDDAGLSCLDALYAAGERLSATDPNRMPMRRLGMEMCAKWRDEWDWERTLEAVREDVQRSGATEMSEEELIRAAEAAKQAYRREIRREG